MKKLSVAEAKAHFSDVVASARRGKSIVILRHGKPAAAVVPVSMIESTSNRRAMTHEEAVAALESFAHLGDPTFDAAADVKAGRR